jgi:hypothetical protein
MPQPDDVYMKRGILFIVSLVCSYSFYSGINPNVICVSTDLMRQQ